MSFFFVKGESMGGVFLLEIYFLFYNNCNGGENPRAVMMILVIIIHGEIIITVEQKRSFSVYFIFVYLYVRMIR